MKSTNENVYTRLEPETLHRLEMECARRRIKRPGAIAEAVTQWLDREQLLAPPVPQSEPTKVEPVLSSGKPDESLTPANLGIILGESSAEGRDWLEKIQAILMSRDEAKIGAARAVLTALAPPGEARGSGRDQPPPDDPDYARAAAEAIGRARRNLDKSKGTGSKLERTGSDKDRS